MSGTKPLLEVSMGIGTFASEWVHCDRISSYVARMVSHNRADPLLHSNLLSSALNELLEMAFAHHGPDGTFSCRVSRNGSQDVIELSLPCDETALGYYNDAAERLRRPDLADVYQSALFSSGASDPHLGLLEIAVDYKAMISIDSGARNRVTVAAAMQLEGAGA